MKRFITPSDSAAIMKMSSTHTPLHVQLRILTGKIIYQDLFAKRLRARMKNVMLQTYTDAFGVMLREQFRSRRCLNHSFLIAPREAFYETSDHRIQVMFALWPEGKWGDEDREEIPVESYIAAQHAMECFNAQSIEYAVILNGMKMRRYRILRNNLLIQKIIEQTGAFWQNHILDRKEVAPTLDHPSTYYLLNDISRIAPGKTIKLDSTAAEIVARYRVYRKAKSESDSARIEAKTQLLAIMGDAEIGILPNGSIIRLREVEKPAVLHKEHSYVDVVIE